MKSWIRAGVLSACWVVASGQAAGAAGAVEIEGAKFEPTVQVADKTLVLNGAGVRKRVLFKVYAAGLYVPEKSNRAATLLAQTGPREIRMHLLRTVHAESFAQAMSEGLHKNHGPQQLAQFKKSMDALDAALRTLGEVQKGDVVALGWVPGVGLRIVVNGRVHGAPIGDEEFFTAVLRVWIGEVPADEALKKGLLGGG